MLEASRVGEGDNRQQERQRDKRPPRNSIFRVPIHGPGSGSSGEPLPVLPRLSTHMRDLPAPASRDLHPGRLPDIGIRPPAPARDSAADAQQFPGSRVLLAAVAIAEPQRAPARLLDPGIFAHHQTAIAVARFVLYAFGKWDHKQLSAGFRTGPG